MQNRFTGTILPSLFLLLIIACNACNSRKGQVPVSLPYTQKTPHPDGTGKVYMGREIAHVMSAAGGDWLERGTRQQEEDADAAIKALPLQPTSVVADIGAGSGYYTFRIAPKLLQGKVYAVEVQEEFIASLEARKKNSGLSNITVVKGSAAAPNLPEASVDLALMVDVYHELEYPKEMLQALYKALRPDGKLLLLEYRAEDPSIPIKELHKMSVAQANKELAAAGFMIDKLETFLPIQHFLLYRKATSKLSRR
ncbi:MAG TPA: class I SAM-dependent methyltransferase [Flavisolibacter sp.]|jgi:ubiquinone/menaquinone biosynthesis C-methylase UbiE|nr:class I SAM-dependent methyltransferase [Flavisolibacter sp.]